MRSNSNSGELEAIGHGMQEPRTSPLCELFGAMYAAEKDWRIGRSGRKKDSRFHFT